MRRMLFLTALVFLGLTQAYPQIPQAGVSAGGAIASDGTVRLFYSAELSYSLFFGNFLSSNSTLSMLTLNMGSRFTADSDLSTTRFLAEIVWFQGLCVGAGLTTGMDGSSVNLFVGGIIPVFPWIVIVLYIRPIWEIDGTYMTEFGMRFKILIIPID